jgi:hypothetical protein
MRAMLIRIVPVAVIAALVAAIILALSGGAMAAREKQTAASPADSSMTLKGGEEGTVFKTLTVEGEDRVHIEFERPALSLDLDPLKAPGLDWQNSREMLARCAVDFVSPLVALSAGDRSPYLARPWLDAFSSGNVARFRPALKDVASWRMTIADSRSRTVTVYEGTGEPPEELGWNGCSKDGKPMPPGLTYSYVLEAVDRAGNKRNFVGKGFELPPYALDTPKELVLLFSGGELGASASRGQSGAAVPPALLLAAASRLNQDAPVDRPIVIGVTARTYKEADNLAQRIGKTLQPLLLGEPGRVTYSTDVQPDSPAAGTVAIRIAR